MLFWRAGVASLTRCVITGDSESFYLRTGVLIVRVCGQARRCSSARSLLLPCRKRVLGSPCPTRCRRHFSQVHDGLAPVLTELIGGALGRQSQSEDDGGSAAAAKSAPLVLVVLGGQVRHVVCVRMMVNFCTCAWHGDVDRAMAWSHRHGKPFPCMSCVHAVLSARSSRARRSRLAHAMRRWSLCVD